MTGDRLTLQLLLPTLTRRCTPGHVPRRREHVRFPAGGGVGHGGSGDECLGAHRGVAVDVGAEMELDDVVPAQRLVRVGLERGGARDGVVDGDARRQRYVYGRASGVEDVFVRFCAG